MISKIIGYGVVKSSEDLSDINYVYDYGWHHLFYDEDNDNTLTLYVNKNGAFLNFTDIEVNIFDNNYEISKSYPYNYVGNFRRMSNNEYMFDIWATEEDNDPKKDSIKDDPEFIIGKGIVEIWNFNLFEYWDTYMRNINYSYLLRFREGYNKNYGNLQAIFHVFSESCYPENVIGLFLKPEYHEVDLDLRIIKNIKWVPFRLKNPFYLKFDITNKIFYEEYHMEYATNTFSIDPTV